MGSIVIEGYQKSGTVNDSYVPVYNLEEVKTRHEDSTTSTTSESVATGAVYVTTPADLWFDIAVPKGTTLFYRTDA